MACGVLSGMVMYTVSIMVAACVAGTGEAVAVLAAMRSSRAAMRPSFCCEGDVSYLCGVVRGEKRFATYVAEEVHLVVVVSESQAIRSFNFLLW